jgi:cell division protease FtsH
MSGGNHTPENYHLTPSSSQEQLPFYLYEFIKAFLYAVYSKRTEYKDFHVIRMTGKSDPTNLKPQLISVTDERGMEYFRVSDTFVDATVCFRGNIYDVSLTREHTHDKMQNIIYALGLEADSTEPDSLIEFLRKESVQKSPYRNSFLEVTPRPAHWLEFEVYVEKVDLRNDRLDDLVLPQSMLDQISLFIEALSEYSIVRKPLRYLFAGKPGTGKTKIIRAIANQCRGKATFIFSSGNETRINSLFKFVELFSPVVLCIDDLDLMVGSRNDRLYFEQLGDFLQKLDGFVERDFFLLATTNDKRLVDIAASRPGRFDQIIDVNLIHPNQYLMLVQSKTEDAAIVSLFDEELLAVLEEKKVTGAFIANLVKHLDLIRFFDPQKLTREYLLQMINQTYRGFYKESASMEEKIGFQFS